ncbi:MAG: alanine racemase [Alphaproteobacteria bacterium]|nr:alanine racemase [Alphaproteobacteria bacterium]
MTFKPVQNCSPPASEAQAILTLDLAALVANWRFLAQRVGSAECSAVIKADAYGIGLEQALTPLLKAGCRSFFVAHVSEGVRARRMAPDQDIKIYLLNGLMLSSETLDQIAQHHLIPVISSLSQWQFWNEHEVSKDLPYVLHVNTGMNRLGLQMDEALSLAGRAKPELIMSHFVSSEIASDPQNEQQIKSFDVLRQAFPGIRASLANSSGIFLPQQPYYDLVRPGYALYGGNPCPDQPNPMRNVVSLSAPILQVREIKRGESVGYNGTWTAQRPTILATLGLGYADGFLRSGSGPNGKSGAEGWLGGSPCPVVGRISMDLTILDVTDAPDSDVRPGALVELLGPHRSIDDLANRSGTIGYEILTSLGWRYHRIYQDG